MTPGRWFVVVGAVAAIAAALWPSPGVSFGESLNARFMCAALGAVALAAIHLTRAGRKRVWLAAGLAAGAAGGVMVYLHARTVQSCVADYFGRPRIIGRVLTDLGLEGVREEPTADAVVLLENVAGEAAAVWTQASIDACRSQVTWSSVASIPLFAIAAGALIATARRRFTIAPAPKVPVSTSVPTAASAPVYDAFMSYRHTEPDKSYALEIVSTLEAKGFRVAIDYRDFSPNEHFLSEMERCIRSSRFVLCVITARFVASDHTGEEAIIAKTIDLAERQKRIVPLIFERVELPVWLYGLSGIDCTNTAVVDPMDRVTRLLSA
jgi:hypothetical protein